MGVVMVVDVVEGVGIGGCGMDVVVGVNVLFIHL